jgi:hypothetical protein
MDPCVTRGQFFLRKAERQLYVQILGTTYQNGEKCTKWRQKIPVGRKIDQMVIKYTNIFL